MTVVHLKEFDPATLSLGAVEAMYGGSGFKAAFKPKALELRLPTLRVPFPIEAKAWQGQGDPTAKLSLAVPDDATAVTQFLHAVDNLAMNALSEHYGKFFPNSKFRPPIDSIFRYSLHESDGDLEPLFRAKLKVKDGSITTPTFDMQTKELMDSNVALGKGALVTAIVQPLHVYALGGNAGVTWSVHRVGLEGHAEAAGTPMEFDFGE